MHYIKKSIATTIIASILTGCGGGGSTTSSSSTNTTTVETLTVVDPYIKDATFFIDKNLDGIYTQGEPVSSLSDENGNFSFSGETITTGQKIIMKDKGVHNGASYTGQLYANISSSGVISPLTTLQADFPDSNLSKIFKDNELNLDNNFIDKDPMKLNSVGKYNDEHIIASISTDVYLKIKNFSNIQPTSTMFKDIIIVVGSLVGQNPTRDDIENSVSIVDYIVQTIKENGNLDELLNFKDETYRNNAKNAIQNRSDKTKPGKLIRGGGDFRGEVAKKDSKLLNNIGITYSNIPLINISTTMTLSDISEVNTTLISWSVFEQPEDANLTLSISHNNDSVTFTPIISGDYTIKVLLSNEDSESYKTIPFTVKENFTYNVNNIDGYTTDTNLSTLLGVVKNQSWIYSKNLSNEQLEDTIDNYSSLLVKGFDKSMGALVEYDDTTSSALEELEYLKNEKDIDNVFNRVYVGDSAFQNYAIYPEDNGNFNDGGTNWHLEKINMPEAWEYTTGSSDFFVGVCDGGFDTLHSDFQGKFAARLTTNSNSHGMGVAGAIAANSNNGIGISGINWNAQVVASYMNDYGAVENTIDTTISGKETKLINNSWGYHLDNTFNPTNATIATQRFDFLQSVLAQFRHLVETRTDKLFLWAAGNGVGNGQSFSGYYGVDAKYDNGNLHYRDGILNKYDNLLVVAALHTSGDLRYYSEYGQSVDIASPTEFDSLSTNNQIYGSFGGTSAATPVVTAVASLVMSINPNLTPAEVKSILIDSATEFVTHRQKVLTTSNGFPTSLGTESLAHPIPILNAKEALKMAYETISTPDHTVIKSYGYISDNVNGKINYRYVTDDNNYHITSVSSTLQSSSTKDGTYSNYISGSVTSSDNIELSLDKSKRYHKINSTVTLTHIFTGETKTESISEEFTYSDVLLHSYDVNTNTSVSSASYDLSYSTIFDDYILSGTTNTSGLAKLYLPFTDVTVVGSKSGYDNVVKKENINDAATYNIDIPFGFENSPNEGVISGFVYDENSNPISDATVQIYTSGDEVMKTTTTNSSGYYILTQIPKEYNSQTIDNFIMLASKDGFSHTMKQSVIVLKQQQRTENFTIISIPENQAPVAEAGENQTIMLGGTAIIGADGSYDLDGYIKTYEWRENGDLLASRHTFVASTLTTGVHELILTVTDNKGAIGSDTVKVTVLAQPYWLSGDWSACQGECDSLGYQTRDVECRLSATQVVENSLCDSNTKPVETQACTTEECPFYYETIESNVTGKIWMDRNLGASKVCESKIETECFGDYYQWGREKDGHQKSNSTTTSSKFDQLNTTNSKFITGTDWTNTDIEGTQRSAKWALNSGEGICPTGFRVPTKEEFADELLENSDVAFSQLKFPVSGFRDASLGGNFVDEETIGVFWSTTVISNNAYSARYYATYDDYGIRDKSDGLNIRCIQDQFNYDNIPPISVPTVSSQNSIYGVSLTFDGSGSYDTDGNIQTYSWTEGDTVLSEQYNFSISNLSIGTHTITLTVTDNNGATHSANISVTINEVQITYSWEVSDWTNCSGDCGTNNGTQTRTVTCKSSENATVSESMCSTSKPVSTQTCTASICNPGPTPNQPPVADAGSDQTRIYGQTVYLNGSDSSDSDGIVTDYEWKNGSTIISRDMIFSVPSLSVGSHTFDLKVADNDGATDSDSVTIIINPYTETYSWYLSDWGTCTGECGTLVGTQTRDILCKNSSGATVNDNLCDADTKPNSTQNCTSCIDGDNNEPPIAVAGSDKSGYINNNITIDGSNSYDNDGEIVSYKWYLNGSLVSSHFSYTFIKTEAGIYIFDLIVTDDDGKTDTDSIIVTIYDSNEDQSYDWNIGNWSSCIGECGIDNGTQSRDVICQDIVGDTVSDNYCTSAKPAVSQSCTASVCIPDTNSTIISPVTGRIWLDRNLGASQACTSLTDTDCYGDYYQWGRDSDGHEKSESLSTITIFDTIEPNMSHFVKSTETDNFDWTIQDESGTLRSSRWSNTIENTGICPNGFRVPTRSELLAENITNANDAYEKLKLPLAGVRTYNNTLEDVGVIGGLWSSTITGGVDSYFFSYDEDSSDWYGHSRAGGRSVRCIKDE